MKQIIVSEVQIRFIKPQNGLIALAEATIDDNWHFSSIGVYQRPNSTNIRITFPSKKLPNGQNFNYFYPINQETEKALRIAVQEKFNEVNNEELQYIYEE